MSHDDTIDYRTISGCTNLPLLKKCTVEDSVSTI